MMATPTTRTPARLARRCACGGVVGPSGECAACRKKRLQRQAVRKSNDDGQEREANAVADAIVSGRHRHPGRLSDRPATTAASQLPYVGPGYPLPPALRTSLEPRLGHAFGDVRIHTDARAKESAQELGARAYTLGTDIAFADGEYSPGTTTGLHLIAHELTHVVQQARRGTRVQMQAKGEWLSTDESQSVPLEKWSPDIESMYRRDGQYGAANALHDCREALRSKRDPSGGWACARLLTFEDIERMRAAYQKGGTPQNLPPAGAGGAALAFNLAPAPYTPPPPLAPPPIAFPPAVTPVPTPPAPAPVPTPPAEVPAATPLVSPAFVAGAAVVLYTGLAVVDLIKLGLFERMLVEAGYIILEHPRTICMRGCHSSQPSAPRPFPRLPLDPPVDFWRFGRLRPDELKKLKDWIDPAPAPELRPRPDEPERRKPTAYPIYWAVQLGPPTQTTFVRTKGERDDDEAKQARMVLGWRSFRDRDFDATKYHVHHIVPLFLGGPDDLRRNGLTLPKSLHLKGHRVLQVQPQLAFPPPPLLPLDPDLYKHPPGIPYRLAGFKTEVNG
jgi:hypothetical protein